jgi:hypothetical protein
VSGRPVGRAWNGYDQLSTGDVTGHRRSDVVATRPDGSLWLLASAGTDPFGAGVRVGASGWAAFSQVFAGDVNGDGRADLLATTPAGALLEYLDAGTPGHPFSAGTTIGAVGWQGFDRLVAGDLTGDGRADIVGRKPDGSLWLYPNTGSATHPYGPSVPIGTSGWNAFDQLLIADFTGDGLADVLARRGDGTMVLYPNQHRPGSPLGSGTPVGGSWASFNRLIGSDVGRTGRADVVAMKPDGTLWLARDTGDPTQPLLGAVQVLPGGWNGATLIAG